MPQILSMLAHAWRNAPDVEGVSFSLQGAELAIVDDTAGDASVDLEGEILLCCQQLHSVLLAVTNQLVTGREGAFCKKMRGKNLRNRRNNDGTELKEKEKQ